MAYNRTGCCIGIQAGGGVTRDDFSDVTGGSAIAYPPAA